jgi:hypothetical protein
MVLFFSSEEAQKTAPHFQTIINEGIPLKCLKPQMKLVAIKL